MTKETDQKESILTLVIDDDEHVRLLLRRYLERMGYAVEEADDGVQGLSAFQRLQPDIVLLDVMMPNMDGYTACARLRSLPGGDRTPILVVTALGDPVSADRALEAGASDYITKPIHPDELQERIQRLLNTR